MIKADQWWVSTQGLKAFQTRYVTIQRCLPCCLVKPNCDPLRNSLPISIKMFCRKIQCFRTNIYMFSHNSLFKRRQFLHGFSVFDTYLKYKVPVFR